MRTTIFLIFLLLLSGCYENNRVDLDLILDARLISSAEKLYDQKELLASLNNIKLFHEKNMTGLKLNHPAPEQDINKAQSFFGCSIPEELLVLWRWHNGESTNKFIWYHRFLSIDESISQYKDLISDSYMRWKKNWIPIFEFEGEWYGVQCGHNTPKASPIVLYFIETGVSVAYTNLTTYLQVMSHSMMNGGLKWKEYWWDADIKIVSKFHAEFNPDVRFPYYDKQ